MEMYVRKLEAQNKALAAQVSELGRRPATPAPVIQIVQESGDAIAMTALITEGDETQVKIMAAALKFVAWILGMKVGESHG